MELSDIRAFVAVSKTGTVAAAAELLSLTAAPVSRALRRLEREVGGELVSRESRKLSLTPFGATLLPHAVAALTSIRALTGQHELRTGASTWAPERYVRMLGEASAGSATRQPSPALLRELAHGDVDLALVHSGEPELPPGIVTSTIARYRPAFFAHRSHPLAERSGVRLADLAGTPVVIPAGFHRRLAFGGVLQQLAEAGVESVVDLPTDAASAQVSALRELQAVTLGSIHDDTPMLRTLPPHGVVELDIVEPRPRLELELAWRRLDDVAGSPLRDAITALTAAVGPDELL